MKTKFSAYILASLALFPSCAAECETGGHDALPCEIDVESPEIVITAAPTLAPTESPSVSPSSFPTPFLSNSPTGNPTEIPTRSPTNAPTDVLTMKPTSDPTISPSVAPSSIPSDLPSLAPSNQEPTDGDCSTQDGIFGDITADIITTVEYGYEVEANATAEEIETDILPTLETTITDSILSEIFVDCNSRRKLRIARRLVVSGISQNPEDLIFSDVECGDAAEGNGCVVVSGELTLYSTDSSSALEMEETILTSIKDNMDAGIYDEVDEDIVRVSYVDLQSSNENGSLSAETNDDQSLGSDSSLLIGVLVGAGVVAGVVVAVAYRKRSTSNQEDATNTEFGEQTTTSNSQLL